MPFKPLENFIRYLSTSNPLMVRDGIYCIFSDLLLSEKLHRAIVDNDCQEYRNKMLGRRWFRPIFGMSYKYYE